MKVVSRRAALRGIGHSAAFGSLAAGLPRHLWAAAPAAAAPRTTYLLVMIFPSGEGISFDADAYRERHLGILKDAYADSVERIELRVAPLPPPPAEGEQAPQAPPFLAAVNIWIRDVSGFVDRVGKNSKAVQADLATITTSAPIVQFDKVIAGLGNARETVTGSASVVSNFFPVREGGSWDPKFLSEAFLPKVLAAYGPAVQRIEATEGAQGQGGAKPLLYGATHIYVADNAAFVRASETPAVAALAPEGAKIATVAPIQTVMLVHAAA